MSKELIAKFINHLKELQRSHSTVIAYAKDLQQLLEEGNHLDLTNLKTEDLKKTLTKATDKHSFTPKTVSRKINSYRTFYDYLMKNNLLSSNPALFLNHPKLQTRTPRVLSKTEHLALRESSRSNARLFTMIELLLQTGIRIGELSRVKVSHLTSDKPDHLFIEEFSTNKARHVPLNSKAREAVKSYLKISKYLENHHHLFTTKAGSPIIIRNIRSSIDKAMEKAGIENASVNDLRNTFIVEQLKMGVPIDYLSEVVGHASKTTTQRYLEALAQTYEANGDRKLFDL